MLQGLGTANSQCGVDLQAARDEVAEFRLVLEDLVDTFQAYDVFPVLYSLVGHSIIDLIAFEDFEEIVFAAFRHPSRHFGLLRIFEDHE